MLLWTCKFIVWLSRYCMGQLQCLALGVLQQLQPLTQSPYLGLPSGDACSKDARVSFRASMPQLRRLDDCSCL